MNDLQMRDEVVPQMKNGALITMSGLVKQYPVGRGHFTALRDIELRIERGERGTCATICVEGPASVEGRP